MGCFWSVEALFDSLDGVVKPTLDILVEIHYFLLTIV
ncbi:hypothetical protein JTS97_00055 [Clostridium botulinum]|nr:hypothetical protein [Clostridium botulinum]